MSLTRKRLWLTRKHYALLLKCFLLVVVIRLTLTFRSYQPVIQNIKSLKGDPKNFRKPLLYVWAIEAVSRLVPGATCLTQALALKWVMTRADQICRIKIGVADTDGKVEAHAWVEENGHILIGGTDEEIKRYTPLVDL